MGIDTNQQRNMFFWNQENRCLSESVVTVQRPDRPKLAFSISAILGPPRKRNPKRDTLPTASSVTGSRGGPCVDDPEDDFIHDAPTLSPGYALASVMAPSVSTLQGTARRQKNRLDTEPSAATVGIPAYDSDHFNDTPTPRPISNRVSEIAFAEALRRATLAIPRQRKPKMDMIVEITAIVDMPAAAIIDSTPTSSVGSAKGKRGSTEKGSGPKKEKSKKTKARFKIKW